MRALTHHGNTAIALATGVTALPYPPSPGQVAYVPHWAGIGPNGSGIPEFDINISSLAANAITAAELFGAIARDGTIAADTVDTVDFANNELDLTAHGLLTGDGPVQLTTSGTLPTGLALLTDYWIIRVAGTADSIQLATSRENAFAGTAVAFSDVGSGTHTLTGTAAAQRIRWYSYGLLGHAADGAVTLTADGKAYTARVLHRQRTIAYGVAATFGSAVATDLEVTPVMEH